MVTTQHFFDGFPLTLTDGSNTAARQTGTARIINQDGWITELAWYRVNASTSNTPADLILWDATTQAQLARVGAPAASGTGWQRSALVPPVHVSTGQHLIIAGQLNASATNPFALFVSTYTPPSAFITDLDTRRVAPVSTVDVFPDGHSTTIWEGFDVTWQDVLNSAPPPVSGGDVASELADWLSVSDNTHGADSAPVHVETLATGATGFDAIKAVADAVASAVGGLPGTIASAVTTITGQVTSATTAIMGTGAKSITQLGADLVTVEDHLIDVLGGVLGGATGSTSGRTAFPTTGWTLADETDFDTDLAWAVPADIYVLTITSVPTGVAADSFAGVTWYHRLGSWAPLNGAQIGARRFIEFTPQQLDDGGRRMPGLALRTKPATLGHVQAWVLA